jgi:hypothetical protein
MRGERAERARGAEQRAERRGFDGMAAKEEVRGGGKEKEGQDARTSTYLLHEQSSFPAHPAPRRDMLRFTIFFWVRWHCEALRQS